MANRALSQLFGRSPIKPMQQHMEVANECAQALIGFFESSQKEDWDEAEARHEHIRTLENEADKHKLEIRQNLSRRLLLPVPRADLLELVRTQDKIANVSRDISGMMLGRKMVIPAAISKSMLALVKAAVATSAQALEAINEMDELLETGFSGREARITEKMIRRLDKLESEADRLEVEVRAKLFAIEDDLPPVKVMFLYNLIRQIGDMADRAQRVGARLQLLLVN